MTNEMKFHTLIAEARRCLSDGRLDAVERKLCAMAVLLAVEEPVPIDAVDPQGGTTPVRPRATTDLLSVVADGPSQEQG